MAQEESDIGLGELIRQGLGRQLDGICSHFIVIGEVVTGSGDFYFVRLDDGDEREWLYKGLLSHALDAEMIPMSEDMEDD